MPAATGSEFTRHHLDKVRAFYEAAPSTPNWVSRGYHGILAHYYNLLIPAGASVLEVGCGTGGLLGGLRAVRKVGVDLSERRITAARTHVPDAEFHVQAGEELPRGKIRCHHRLRHAQLRHRCAAAPRETAHRLPCGHAACHRIFPRPCGGPLFSARKVAGPEEPRSAKSQLDRDHRHAQSPAAGRLGNALCSPACFCRCSWGFWRNFSTACSRHCCQPSA